MPSPANLGFEAPGASPGLAASWTVAEVFTALEYAGYLIDGSGFEYPYDSFEGKWGAVQATGDIFVMDRNYFAFSGDGETFTLDDGINAPTVFEFDTFAGVTPGNVAVYVGDIFFATDIRDRMVSAINGVGASLRITAFAGDDPVQVHLINDLPGAFGNAAITDTVADSQFIVQGMANGYDAQNEDYLFEFDLLVDVDFALYSFGLLLPQPAYEAFSVGWDFNQEYLFEHGSTAAADYDTGTPEAFEDFEEQWGNTTYLTSFGGGDTTAANYDTAPEAFEDFEENWFSNESYLLVFGGGDTTLASYDSTSPQAFEDFEQTKAPVVVTADPDPVNVFTSPVAHGHVNGDKVSIASDGAMPAGISPKNDYRIITASSNTFQLSSTVGGSVIKLTSPGGGQIKVYGDKGLKWVQFLN